MKYPVEYTIGSHKSFQDFRKDVPELKNIRIPLFRKIIEESGQAFTDRIVSDGDTIKLPNRMGEIGLKGIKQPIFNDKGDVVLSIDHARTKVTGVEMYYENLHSDRYRYNIVWYKKMANFHNNEFWKFLGASTNFRNQIRRNIELGVEYYKKLVQ